MTRQSVLFNIQFETFKLIPRNKAKNKYVLVAKGKPIDSTWFTDRPARSGGQFDFDSLVGKQIWNRIFPGSMPNSVLSGNGESIVFKNSNFKSFRKNSYKANIEIINSSSKKIPRRWKDSSLTIDNAALDGVFKVYEGREYFEDLKDAATDGDYGGLATWISKKAIDRVVAKHVGEDMRGSLMALGAGIPTDGLDICWSSQVGVTPLVISNWTSKPQTASIEISSGTALNVGYWDNQNDATGIPKGKDSVCDSNRNSNDALAIPDLPEIHKNITVQPGETVTKWLTTGGQGANKIGGGTVALGGLPKNTPGQSWYDLDFYLGTAGGFKEYQVYYNNTGGIGKTSKQNNFNIVPSFMLADKNKKVSGFNVPTILSPYESGTQEVDQWYYKEDPIGFAWFPDDYEPPQPACPNISITPLIISNYTKKDQTASLTANQDTGLLGFFDSYESASQFFGDICDTGVNFANNTNYSDNIPVKSGDTIISYMVVDSSRGTGNNIAIGGLPNNTPGQSWYNFNVQEVNSDGDHFFNLQYQDTGGIGDTNKQANFNVIEAAYVGKSGSDDTRSYVNIPLIVSNYSSGFNDENNWINGEPIGLAWLGQPPQPSS